MTTGAVLGLRQEEIAGASPPETGGTTRPPSSSWWWPALAAVTLTGTVLRAFAFHSGWLRVPVDYDEGVYSAAGQLLSVGRWLYRDVAFVHPPGIAYVTVLTAPLGPYRSLAVSRVLMAFIGVASILVVGLVARRAWGPIAGIVAAAVYATAAEVVWAEHGVFIEPLLNLLSLGAVACWMRMRAGGEPARPWRSWATAAGVCLAAAAACKVWAVALAIALVVALPRAQPRARVRRCAAGFAVTSAVLWGPVVAAAGPGRVLDLVVRFHLDRPADGIVDRWTRLRLIAGAGPGGDAAWWDPELSRHLPAAVVVLAGVVLAAVTRDALARLAAVWLAVLVAVFVSAAAYWDQYNAALGPPAALCAGYLARWVLTRRRRWATAVLGAAVAVTVVWGIRVSWHESWSEGGEPAAMISAIRSEAPADAAVCAFEPAWLLGAGRLPPAGTGFPLVDPYASQLLAAPPSGDLSAALAASATEPAELFRGCDLVALGFRGRMQMSAAQRSWFVSHYQPVSPAGLWKRGA